MIFQSPKLIISEGIADLALTILFTDRDAVEISLREFCPDPSKEDSYEMLIAQGMDEGGNWKSTDLIADVTNGIEICDVVALVKNSIVILL